MAIRQWNQSAQEKINNGDDTTIGSEKSLFPSRWMMTLIRGRSAVHHQARLSLLCPSVCVLSVVSFAAENRRRKRSGFAQTWRKSANYLLAIRRGHESQKCTIIVLWGVRRPCLGYIMEMQLACSIDNLSSYSVTWGYWLDFGNCVSALGNQ